MTGIQGDDNRNRLSLGALGNTGNASRSSAILWYGYNNPDPYPGDTLEAKWEMGNDYYLNATQTFYLYDSVNSTLKYLLNSYGIGFPQKTFCGMLPSSDYDSVLNILTTSGSAFKVYHESSSSSFFNFAVISGGGAQGYSTSHYGLMEAYTGGGRMSFEFFPEEMIIKTGNGTKTLWMYSDHTAKFFNSLTIGSGAAGVDYTLTFDGETNDGILTWMEDEDYFKFNDDIFIGTEKLYFNGTDTSFYESGDDVHLDTPSNKTLVLDEVVYDDIRVVPGSFDRPGASDPTMVAVTPGGGTTTYLWEFKKNDIASFTVQLPHSYKTGQDIKVHIHWTPGDRGNEENGNTVGWKIDYTWANINGAFGTMSTADCSDACNGTDWEHDMTPDIVIDGHTAAKGISSMLICNIKRTDTGTDDTWVSTTSGQLPLLLEIDFHFPIDTIGSRDWGAK
jgi:hypothetical protein